MLATKSEFLSWGYQSKEIKALINTVRRFRKFNLWREEVLKILL